MNPKSSTGGTASVPSNIFNVMPTSASSPAIFSPSKILEINLIILPAIFSSSETLEIILLYVNQC